jgi:2-keto-4-pentenoate hydratase/2-oxohepta-3-ene-1,7-dioic acid hydratase in catechol pathway
MKVATPEYPEVFLKPASTVTTATDPIIIPKTCHDQVDGEVELAVIIGKDCKGFDTFCPLGPVVVSRQSLPDPKVLELKTMLNGKVMQDGKARNMIFSIEDILVYLSSVSSFQRHVEVIATNISMQGHTLKKGTVILTGTPSGIGASYDPPIYLQKGADLKVSISHGLGTLVNSIL